MRIASVHLKEYKRFTDLHVHSIPESARLVVLVGPNGSGKSSLFDAFLFKSQARSNQRLEGELKDYYQKKGFERTDLSTTQELRGEIDLVFHGAQPGNERLAEKFNVRSAYRNEADFRLQRIEPTRRASERPRFNRIIDLDQAVSDNYSRLAWKRIRDVDYDAPGGMTLDEYRAGALGELQEAMKVLFTDPALQLESFGSIEDSGTFLFSKGESQGFRYSNLSGGEKAAFDLLLDIFVKRNEFRDAIYCIDEPESHIATGLQGPLLDALLALIPSESQLWIATHSIGFVRKASDRMRDDNDVVFLDFAGLDFDREVELRPRVPDRAFWRRTYQIALDDLSELIAPAVVVLCEGSQRKADRGFDAQCYNRIFANGQPEALFISNGSSSEVEGSDNLVALLNAVSHGTQVLRLIDRDGMGDDTRDQKLEDGLRVLRRREIENYLYDPDVLTSFLEKHERSEFGAAVLKELSSDTRNFHTDDVRRFAMDVFEAVRTRSGIPNVGRNYKEFAIEHLSAALACTQNVLNELSEDVFPQR